MNNFILCLRYIFGVIMLSMAAFEFFSEHTPVEALFALIISLFLLLPPSVKFKGYTGILAVEVNLTPYLLFTLCRWTAGFFYCVGAMGSFRSGSKEAVMMFLVGVLMISPLDRFFFPRLSNMSNIYVARNTAIFAVYFAPIVYSSNNVIAAYCMFIAGVGTLFMMGLTALKNPVVAPVPVPISFRTGIDIKKILSEIITEGKKLMPAPKQRKPRYHDAYVLQWKLKPSNINNEYFQELIQFFQDTWLAANEYPERLKMHRNQEEYKEQTIQVLTDYIEKIWIRPEMLEGINSVADRISEIWKGDKRLRSLFLAMKKYTEQKKSKRLWVIFVHVAEYRAMINLVKRIKRSQVKSSIKRSQEAILQTDLYRNSERISVLDMNTYFQIIDYIILLGKNLENYKELNDKFNEERYRDYFLPFLNAVNPAYSTKGEVFNRLGKTDILISDNKGNNIFIAECKLWHGEAYLLSAVDQLLNNYVNWRDEKTAIIIFNREMKQFSQLILTATEAMTRHPLCLQSNSKRSETSWSYLFRHPDDERKVIRLELVLFNFA